MINKLVIAHSGLAGISNISLGLASLLKANFEVIIATSNLGLREQCKSIGVGFSALPVISYDFTDEAEGQELMNQYRETLERLAPDFVLVDEELHELFIASRQANMKSAVFTQWFYNIPFRTPPLQSNLQPNQRFAVFISWLKIKRRQFLRKNGKRRSQFIWNQARLAGLNRYMVPVNFPPHFTYFGNAKLNCNYRLLEFLRKPPENTLYLGGVITPEAHQRNIPASLISMVTETEKRLIYVTLGSMDNLNKELFIRLVSLAEAIEEYLFIFSAVGMDNYLDKPSANCMFLKWAPQRFILKHASICINHGGINTINECIEYEVPMIVFPGGKFDQNGCAQRIKYFKLGCIGNPDCDVSEFYSVIEGVVNNTDYKRNLRNVKNSVPDQQKAVMDFLNSQYV